MNIVEKYKEGCSINRLSYISGINEKKLRQMLVNSGIEIRGRNESRKAYHQQTNKELERENCI